MDGIGLNIGLVLLFVLVGGYFSASELALVSLREGQVARLSSRSRRGATVSRLREDPNRFLAAVQIGVTLAGFFSAAYGGSTLAAPLGGLFTSWGLPAGLAGTLALVVVTALISFVSLVLGELVPKRLALQRAEGVALFVAPVLDRIASLARPVIWLLSRTTDGVVRLLGLNPRAGGEQVSEEELRDMVASHEQLDREERRVLADVFDAADRHLREVMLPRTEVDFLRAATDLEEATRAIVGKPHSRYPVTGEGVDDVVGVVHVRDLLTAALRSRPGGAPRTVGDVMRPVHALPENKPMLVAMSEMRARRVHLAVVVDEYGGTAGIVTLEDLIEEIVGDIDDEFDSPRLTSAVRDRADGDGGEALLDGLLHRDEFRDRTGLELPDGAFDTLGGYVQDALGRIPAVGDHVPLHGAALVVAEMDGRRVASVRFERTTDTASGRPQDGP
ncbi:hemolysin family protein [Pseudonocardia sichuanensis]|uniref:Putative hemolysin n=1 Tax=Pseudonocardia kunmingensis TaxID=630975 RepID=A0A543DLR4_9PSEU|nr:hemolysin family protein [Pseudonocardia kunmingensis]TQM10243.1 putative hemolysin [Pseudonocardia kunmingensis]